MLLDDILGAVTDGTPIEIQHDVKEKEKMFFYLFLALFTAMILNSVIVRVVTKTN